MEGQGITSYSSSRPSYGFSASTTEFDDELIKRGIVNQEQALQAKGATLEQADRLVELQRAGEAAQDAPVEVLDRRSEDEEDGTRDRDDSSDDDEDFLDDDFLDRYRQQRLDEMRRQHKTLTEPVLISRDEWTRHVNEASEEQWVVVCLTSSDTERTGRVEEAVRILAARQAHKEKYAKFVFIPSRSAIPNWPDECLPSLFLYRHGTMQQELVGVNPETTADEVECLLEEAGVYGGESTR